ncbi:MAG: hypothetical protein IT249_04025 [Chitinophagaceae bacterium]|nr:hypothetical protein [Chitinophagaceae bacterium]
MKKVYFFTLLLFAIAFCTAIIQGCNNNNKNVNAQQNHAPLEFREKLSDYGFFSGKLNELHPASNVIPYKLATPLFSDYAVKDRFIVLPPNKHIVYTPEDILGFPDSTFIIKNFAYTNTLHQKIMIETRLLVKDPFDKKWKVMNYLWNKEQTDAVKHITGAKIPVTLLNDAGEEMSTIYSVPNTNDCKRCHIKNDVLTPIGPKARNINFTPDAQNINQLSRWASAGILEGMPGIDKVPQLPDWRDSKHFTLEQRARAYLDVNCAHCHTKGGDAYNTGLFLEYEQKEPHYIGIMKEPVSAGAGAGGLNYDIIPGNAKHSILLYRMNSKEPGIAMPELARTIIHKEAVQLITDWINDMAKQYPEMLVF